MDITEKSIIFVVEKKNKTDMNYNYLSDSENILIILDKMGAVSPETAITTEEIVEKGIELGMTKEVLTDHWHGHKEGDHPWWLLLAPMSGVGSETEVAKHDVPHLHRQKIQRMKNGRKTNVMVYWYDESYTHDITYTGKAYKEKLQRIEDRKRMIENWKNAPKTREEWEKDMPSKAVNIDGKWVLKEFIISHPEKFTPAIVAVANLNYKG